MWTATRQTAEFAEVHPDPSARMLIYPGFFEEEAKVTCLSLKTLYFVKVMLQFFTKQKETLNQSQALYLDGNFLALLL